MVTGVHLQMVIFVKDEHLAYILQYYEMALLAWQEPA